MNDENLTIFDAIHKADDVINKKGYDRIAVSISGGADSDVMMDLIYKADKGHKVHYIWFDTGIEYEATKRHLAYLEDRYGVQIERERAIKSIPISVHEYGIPFISKYVSEMIWRCQRHGFQWDDITFEEAQKKYEGMTCANKWWCSCYSKIDDDRKQSHFDINYNSYLKEFMIANPIPFKVSNKCCLYAKKNVSKKYIEDHDIQLMITGIRKSEGGVRSISYSSCFNVAANGVAYYRHLFWMTDADKAEYDKEFNIVHSDCYTVYGMKRTGCAGCPYNRHILQELNEIQFFEPKLYRACWNLFGESYEYTRKYREFQKEMKLKRKNNHDNNK